MEQPSRLETVSVDHPCPKRWSELVGDDTRRFCSECRLHVTNLSAMTRAEGEAFLAEQTGSVCVTYVPATGGGARPLESRPRAGLLRRLAHLAALALGVLAFLPGCRPADARPDGGTPPPDPDEDHLTGSIVGKVRADPQCAVDDDHLIMGEMVAPDASQDGPDVDAGDGEAVESR